MNNFVFIPFRRKDTDKVTPFSIFLLKVQPYETDKPSMITLFYMEEKTLIEIVFILGMKESNTKEKLHHLQKKLYILIKNED